MQATEKGILSCTILVDVFNQVQKEDIPEFHVSPTMRERVSFSRSMLLDQFSLSNVNIYTRILT